jgi:hypothetical protein
MPCLICHREEGSIHRRYTGEASRSQEETILEGVITIRESALRPYVEPALLSIPAAAGTLP